MSPPPLASPPEGLPALPFERLPASLRPNENLLLYYGLSSLLLGPLFPILLIPLFFRYRTLRYEVDEEGISMRWGILFRREVSLTYARIQDIHLSSNVVERWLGLARIQVQTASGSASAEMTIEGIPAFAALRDFLYSRMRGARENATSAAPAAAATSPHLDAGVAGELADVLGDVASELRALRLALEERAHE